MRRVSLYVVHPDRSVERHPSKVRLPGYLDTKKGRWLFEQHHIFHEKPLAAFGSWDEFLAWRPAVTPPKNPAALAIAGDVVPQSPVPMTDDELAEALARTPVAAAQDLMTSVGVMDTTRSSLTWAMAGVMAACALAIMFIIVMAALAYLGREADGPQQPELAPAMTQPTPWPWSTAPTPATSTTPGRPRRRRLFTGMPRYPWRDYPRLRWPEPKGRLLVYDVGLPEQPYVVSLPLGELRSRLGGLHELRQGGKLPWRDKRLWACRRDGEAVEPLPLQRDPRTTRTPEYMAEYMRLRADKDILSRPQGRAETFMLMGAAVGIVVTTVSGLILVIALTGS